MKSLQCLQRGSRSPYRSGQAQDYDYKTLILGSHLDINRIFAPEILVLDHHANETRTLAYRGTVKIPINDTDTDEGK